jgi:hypothetical protein
MCAGVQKLFPELLVLKSKLSDLVGLLYWSELAAITNGEMTFGWTAAGATC